MTAIELSEPFRRTALGWISDGYSIDVRIAAKRATDAGEYEIVGGSVGFVPRPYAEPESAGFEIELSEQGYYFAQSQLNDVPLEESRRILADAMDGWLSIGNKRLHLHNSSNVRYSRRADVHGEWFNTMNLVVSSQWNAGDRETDQIDDALRGWIIPFDGASDLLNWLGLASNFQANAPVSLTISVNSPVDVNLAETKLENGMLDLKLLGHPNLNIDDVRLAVRGVPDRGVRNRRQLSGNLQWAPAEDGVRLGRATVAMPSVDSALVMLSLGGDYVRRHWFIDPRRSQNERFDIAQTFDPNLETVKKALLEWTSQEKFEQAVATLMYVSGFNPMIWVETEAPDITAVTPGGQLAMIECTLKTKDIHLKIGKLVDRREELAAKLSAGGRPSSILTILACQAPRDRVAMSDAEFAERGVILFARESLHDLAERVRYQTDADAAYNAIISASGLTGH